MYELEMNGKKMFCSTKEHFEDFIREICGEEAYEAYRDLVLEEREIVKLKEELEAEKDAKEEWERISDGHYRHLLNIMETCREMKKDITSSLRLNRKKILSYIKEIENEVE